MLSKKTKYAFHALTFLGHQSEGALTKIETVAVATSIPKKFLESILLDMRKAGLLASKSGKGGGYYLNKTPRDIRLAQIVRMFNGPIAMLPCVSLNYYESCEECPDEEHCGLNKIMIDLRDESLKILENKTLQDILKLDSNWC